MEITWYGLTCFRMIERGLAAILTDPYPPEVGVELPRTRADVITVSCENPSVGYTTGIRGPYQVFDGPGEYEVGGVFITGISTFSGKKEKADGLNTIFSYDFDGLTVCHLGQLGHVPKQSEVEDLGAVDVLLVPVGGGGSLTVPQASEVISLFEPSVVIPMYYKIPGLEIKLDGLNRFLKEMGLEKVKTLESVKLTRSGLSEETEVVVLEPKQ